MSECSPDWSVRSLKFLERMAYRRFKTNGRPPKGDPENWSCGWEEAINLTLGLEGKDLQSLLVQGCVCRLNVAFQKGDWVTFEWTLIQLRGLITVKNDLLTKYK